MKKRLNSMLFGFLILVVCQFLGEIIVSVFDLTIPGPVMGMLVLLLGLIIRGHVSDSVGKASDNLMKYIGLLFVPAGAGISMFLTLIVEEWDVILVASVISTIFTLAVCGLIFQIFNRGDES